MCGAYEYLAERGARAGFGWLARPYPSTPCPARLHAALAAGAFAEPDSCAPRSPLSAWEAAASRSTPPTLCTTDRGVERLEDIPSGHHHHRREVHRKFMVIGATTCVI